MRTKMNKGTNRRKRSRSLIRSAQLDSAASTHVGGGSSGALGVSEGPVSDAAAVEAGVALATASVAAASGVVRGRVVVDGVFQVHEHDVQLGQVVVDHFGAVCYQHHARGRRSVDHVRQVAEVQLIEGPKQIEGRRRSDNNKFTTKGLENNSENFWICEIDRHCFLIDLPISLP